MAHSTLRIADANRAVDTIVRTMHEGGPGGTFVVSETIKAGSLGHGTTVTDHYDLDLVVYSVTIDGNDIVRNGFDQWLRIVERQLESKLPGRIQDRHTTSRSLQFNFDGYIDVDTLVSPFWREPRLFYEFLQQISRAKRSMFSVSASKWQVEFFSGQPDQVKELIKRAKAWRNVMWSRDRTGKPKSYLISVLVLRSYEIAKTNLLGDISFPRLPIEVTRVMKSIVQDNQRADIYWEEYYNKFTYRDLFPPSLPRIVDPANPANNLHESGIAGRNNVKAQDYQDGGGSWAPFVRNICTLDLTRTVDEIRLSSF